MIRKSMFKLVWGAAFLGLITAASADVLLIEKVRERMSRDLPGNGLTMDEVERRFGQPVERMPAVGDPPITRWTYDEYSVFFEHNLVIESVVHHQAVVRETERAESEP